MVSAKFKTIYSSLKFLLTQDHMENAATPMSAKVYEDIDYHGGIQAIFFLGSQPRFKKIVTL